MATIIDIIAAETIDGVIDPTVIAAAVAAVLNTPECLAERTASCPNSQTALPGLAAGTASGGGNMKMGISI